MDVFRSAREAVGALLGSTAPGDFVQLRSIGARATAFGRVLAPDDPALQGRQIPAGRAAVLWDSGQVQDVDPADLLKTPFQQVPPRSAQTLAPRDQAAVEVLADLDPDLAEEFGLDKDRPVIGRPDPVSSMNARMAQRRADVRNKKSFAMRQNWRRSKSRNFGGRRLGNEPGFMKQNPLQAFESLMQEQEGEGGEKLTPIGGSSQGMSKDDVAKIDSAAFTDNHQTYKDFNPKDPRISYLHTQQVFEATNRIMKSLAVSKGVPYYQWIQDDPETGMIRIKVNGTCPKEVIENFMRGLEEMELTILEQPQQVEDEDTSLIGNWVFEAQLPGFEDAEEPHYEHPESSEFATKGEYPGEIMIPEQPAANTEA